MISGTIPVGISRLTRLKGIELYSNHITGSTPYDVFMSDAMQHIAMDDNLLTGSLPGACVDGSIMHSLRLLNIF